MQGIKSRSNEVSALTQEVVCARGSMYIVANRWELGEARGGAELRDRSQHSRGGGSGGGRLSFRERACMVVDHTDLAQGFKERKFT